MHKDYGYTQEWVDFLSEKLKDSTEFESLYKLEITDSVDGPDRAPSA
jgi:hypothetical protein